MQKHRSGAQDRQAGAEQVKRVSGSAAVVAAVVGPDGQNLASGQPGSRRHGQAVGSRGGAGRWGRGDRHADMAREHVIAGGSHQDDERGHHAGNQPPMSWLQEQRLVRAHQPHRTQSPSSHAGPPERRPACVLARRRAGGTCHTSDTQTVRTGASRCCEMRNSAIVTSRLSGTMATGIAALDSKPAGQSCD